MKNLHKERIFIANVNLYKQGKNILKTEVLHIFRWIFPFFKIKIIIIQIPEEICWCEEKKLDVWIDSLSASRIRDPILNSDLLDPDPAENGLDPQPWVPVLVLYQ